MHLLRASFRSLPSPNGANLGRAARTVRPCAQQQWARAGRRSYASATDTIKKASGDMPWLLAATIVTVPGVYFALQPSASAGHGDDHGDEHGDHGAEDSEHHDDEGDEGKDDSTPAEKSDEPSKTEGEDGDQGNDDKEDEGGESDDGPEGKKAAKVDGVNFAGGTVKRESDAKGATKKRIDSDLAKNVGEGVSSGTEDDMSNKQRGYSNTDTRHSTDPSKDPGKSSKGEGTADTAKVKGTVDGKNRPQV